MTFHLRIALNDEKSLLLLNSNLFGPLPRHLVLIQRPTGVQSHVYSTGVQSPSGQCSPSFPWPAIPFLRLLHPDKVPATFTLHAHHTPLVSMLWRVGPELAETGQSAKGKCPTDQGMWRAAGHLSTSSTACLIVCITVHSPGYRRIT